MRGMKGHTQKRMFDVGGHTLGLILEEGTHFIQFLKMEDYYCITAEGSDRRCRFPVAQQITTAQLTRLFGVRIFIKFYLTWVLLSWWICASKLGLSYKLFCSPMVTIIMMDLWASAPSFTVHSNSAKIIKSSDHKYIVMSQAWTCVWHHQPGTIPTDYILLCLNSLFRHDLSGLL